jgi:hypothetical protein
MLQGWADQQGPPRCRSKVPPPCPPPDRGPGGGQPAVHPRPEEGAGARALSAVLAPGPTRLPQTRLTRPGGTAPTCVNAKQRTQSNARSTEWRDGEASQPATTRSRRLLPSRHDDLDQGPHTSHP